MAPVGLYSHPSAGYILNLRSDAADGSPGHLSRTERDCLRALAEDVVAISNRPDHGIRKNIAA